MVRGRGLSERLGRFAFAGAVALALTIILAPLVLVVWLSFFRNEILSLPPEGYSLRWYGALAAQRQGLVAAASRSWASIVAWTRTGSWPPYHRLGHGSLAKRALLATPREQAEATMRARRRRHRPVQRADR